VPHTHPTENSSKLKEAKVSAKPLEASLKHLVGQQGKCCNIRDSRFISEVSPPDKNKACPPGYSFSIIKTSAGGLAG